LTNHGGKTAKTTDGRGLTHLDARGRARMVDVGGKAETAREAVARCRIVMARDTAAKLTSGDLPKGDALAVARVAGIMAAKKTSDLIPLCHPLELSSVAVDFTGPDEVPEQSRVCLEVEARVRLTGRTGAEMEALTACAVAALTLYDMVKAVDRGMTIPSGSWRSRAGRAGPGGGERISSRTVTAARPRALPAVPSRVHRRPRTRAGRRMTKPWLR